MIEHGRKISLLSESREIFPRLDYALRDVRIRGRVAAIAGRVDRLVTPRPINLADLLDEQRALLDPDRFRDRTAPAMLRDLWARRGLTFSQFEEKVRRLRLLAGSRFRIGRGHMHDLMQADATSQDSVPRLETFFALAAIFLLDPVDLLRGYNMPPDGLPLIASEDPGAWRAPRSSSIAPAPIVSSNTSSGADGRCRGCCRCSTGFPRAGAPITLATPP